jgi:hypothetical protein
MSGNTPEGQLITLEGTLKYREVEEDVEGAKFKHRIAEVHATGMKRLSKVVSDLKRLDLLSVQGISISSVR